MLVPLSLLKQWIPLPMPLDLLAEKLTLSGLEVDAIDTVQCDFTGVVVVKITDITPHPTSNKLRIVTITDGQKDYTVVCADLSCFTGMITAFANVGAKLKLNSDTPILIASKELAGVSSPGMLVSEKELSLSQESSSIYKLDPSVPLGTDLATLEQDTILDIALTPNLGHCTSVYGIARHIATLFDLEIKAARPTSKDLISKIKPHKLEVSAKGSLSYLSCLTIEKAKVGDSPHWLKKALLRSGIRSINNVVDATNFIMLTLGQPMHAYDKAKLKDQDLDVTLLQKQTPFTALDGAIYTLPEKALVVVSGNETVGIAGVMGSEKTQVSDQTKTIVLEAGCFNAGLVRSVSKAINLRTEASNRFEKGIDLAMCETALIEATNLIIELTSGHITHWDRYEAASLKKKVIRLRLKQVNRILGTHLALSEVETIFQKLFFKTSVNDDTTINIEVPSYRNDITDEIDLVEEVAIVYGYENLVTKQAPVSLSPLSDSPCYKLEKKIRAFMVAKGLCEISTCSLISPELSLVDAHRRGQDDLEPVSVLIPGSRDQSVLRTSLLPGMLSTAKHNIDHNIGELQGFEIGKIHFKHNGTIYERLTLGIIMLGKRAPYFFASSNPNCDFFLVKGAVQSLLDAFAPGQYDLKKEAMSSFHPSNQQSILLSNDNRVGILGQLHPTLCSTFSIKEEVFYAELDLQPLLTTENKNPKARAPVQFPSSSRDWTLPLDKSLSYRELKQTLDAFNSDTLETFQLLDVYEGDKLPATQKNVTLRFTYRKATRTLTQDMVDKEHALLMRFTREKLKRFLV